MDLKKLRKWIEAVNTYYAFAVLVYAVSLYITSHSSLFKWVFIVATPIITGWTGYAIRSLVVQHFQRHGASLLSDTMTYEVMGNDNYSLRYSTKIRACTDHLMVYPLGYRWTGYGNESIPKLADSSQELLGLIERYNKKQEAVKIAPYRLSSSSEGDWHFWFVAFNPPMHKGETATIQYTQQFHDNKGMAKPCMRYFVRTPMKQLELNVKFPKNAIPVKVTASYFKPLDSRRPYQSKGLKYDPDKQWATWVIERPKKGYCYRICWE